MYNCIQFFAKSLYKLDCIQYNRLHIQERKGIYMTEKRVLNFSAGPSMLPEPVLEKAAKQMLNYENSGMSVMEMSHRSSSYLDIFEKTSLLCYWWPRHPSCPYTIPYFMFSNRGRQFCFKYNYQWY